MFKNVEMAAMYPLSVLLVFAYCLKPFYFASYLPVFYAEKTKNLGKYSLIAAIVNLVLTLVLFPYFGIVAAAVSTMVAYGVLAFYRFFTNEFRSTEKLRYYPLVWVFVFIVISLCGYHLSCFDIIYRYLIFFIILVCAIVVFRLSQLNLISIKLNRFK